MKTDVIRGFVSILGSKVTTLFLGLLTTPILVCLLGSSQYRDYAFLLSILGITMVLINEGFLMELGSTLPKTEKITIGLNMSLDFISGWLSYWLSLVR